MTNKNKEFHEGKEAYCPQCYFELEKIVLRKECAGHQPKKEEGNNIFEEFIETPEGKEIMKNIDRTAITNGKIGEFLSPTPLAQRIETIIGEFDKLNYEKAEWGFSKGFHELQEHEEKCDAIEVVSMSKVKDFITKALTQIAEEARRKGWEDGITLGKEWELQARQEATKAERERILRAVRAMPYKDECSLLKERIIKVILSPITHQDQREEIKKND